MMGARRRAHPKFLSNLSDRRRLLMSVKVMLDIIQHPTLSRRYRHSGNLLSRSWANIIEYSRMNVYPIIKNRSNFSKKHSLTDAPHNVRIHGVTVLTTVARPVRPRFAVSIGQSHRPLWSLYESRN